MLCNYGQRECREEIEIHKEIRFGSHVTLASTACIVFNLARAYPVEAGLRCCCIHLHSVAESPREFLDHLVAAEYPVADQFVNEWGIPLQKNEYNSEPHMPLRLNGTAYRDVCGEFSRNQGVPSVLAGISL